MAVEGKKIIYVGTDADVENFITKETVVSDLDGQMLMPGFIDTHAHPLSAAGFSEMLVLDFEGGVEDWLSQIEAHANSNSGKRGFMAFGFNVEAFGHNGPTREMLDGVVPDIPVVVIDIGGHTGWFNTKAMEMVGLNRETPDPVPDVHYYKRGADGEMTGFCVEQIACFPMLVKLGFISEESIVTGSKRVFPMFSGFGYTTIYEAGFNQIEALAYPAIDKLAKAGGLPFRVVTSHIIQSSSMVEHAIENLSKFKADYASELVRPQVIKIHNDGTMEAFNAALFEPFVGQPENRGSIVLEGGALQNFVTDISASGFDVHIHAIGDRAVDEALDAFEVARTANPNSRSRFSIGHTELIRDEDVLRFGELDVIAETTPFWFEYSPGESIVASLGEERASRRLTFRKVIDSGGKVTFGSDWPATGPAFGVDPLLNIGMGVTRQFPIGDSEPLSAESLTVEEMIEGYTSAASYQLNMEKEIGSLEVGKLADMIVVNKNLLDMDPYDIYSAKVELTMMNGEVVFVREPGLWQKFLETTGLSWLNFIL